MPNISETLLDSARARAMSARALAAELQEPLSRVMGTMSDLAAQVTGTRPTMHETMTFDRALAMGGQASAAGSTRGPSVMLRRPRLMRVVRVPARYVAQGCHGCGTASGPTGPSVAYKPPGTPGYYRVPAAVQCLWTVEAGETPSEIAYWITGSGGVARVRELLDANPEKPRTGTPGTPGYNFATFKVGESIKLPKTWNVYLVPGGSVGAKSLIWGSRGGVYPEAPAAEKPAPVPGDFVSTLPDGAITAAKGKLGAWGLAEKIPGWAYPGPYDLNDAVDESFRAAVRAFQQWSNARGGKLREDGAFDQPTAAALVAYAPSSDWPTGVPVVPWPSKELTLDTPGVKKSDSGAAPILLAALAAKVFGVF